MVSIHDEACGKHLSTLQNLIVLNEIRTHPLTEGSTNSAGRRVCQQ
jgi:hypothetical protein